MLARGGGERRGKSRRLELLSRLPSFLGKITSRRLVSRLSPVARPCATEILPSLKCKVSENKGKQDGGARVLWQFPPLPR